MAAIVSPTLVGMSKRLTVTHPHEVAHLPHVLRIPKAYLLFARDKRFL